MPKGKLTTMRLDMETGETVKDPLDANVNEAQAVEMISKIGGRDIDMACSQMLYHLNGMHNARQMSDGCYNMLAACLATILNAADCTKEEIDRICDAISDAQRVADGKSNIILN